MGIVLVSSMATADEPAATSNVPRSPKIWLSDLPEQDAKVGWGKFGKNGWAGFEPLPITIRAASSHHGLGMHPDANVQYTLGKKYRTFRGTAAMNDSANPGSSRPVIFRVLADGKLLWESYGLHRSPQAQPCMLDITGVDALRLEVVYRPGATGDQGDAHAVWIDPYVTTDPTSPAVLAMFDPRRFARIEKTEDFLDHVRKLVDKGDFDELEACAKKAREDEDFAEGIALLSGFYRVLSEPRGATEDWEQHIAPLNRWKKAKPDSVAALVALAGSYRQYAFQARGDGYANSVSAEGWKLLGERLAKGRTFLEEALTKKDLDAGLFVELMRYELGQGSGRAKCIDYFHRGRKIAPRHYPLYADLANYLLPRWHGEPGEIQRLAASLRKEIGGDRGDEIYFRMSYAELETLGENFFKETDFKYEDLKPGMRVVMRDYPENFQFINSGCFLACVAGDKEQATQLMARIDAGTCEAQIWQGYGRIAYWRQKFDPQGDAEEQLQTLFGNVGWVRSLIFTKDGQLLSGGESPVINRWNLETGKIVGSIDTKNLMQRMVADAEGRTIIACYGFNDRFQPMATVHPLNGDPPKTLQGHAKGIAAVAITADGARYGTAAHDNTARIWKSDDLSHPMVLNHPEWAFDVAFSSDGKLAATTSYQGGLWLWDAQTGEAKGKPLVDVHGGPWQCFVHFLPDDKGLITASVDGTIRRWDLAARKFEEVRTSEENIGGMALSSDGRWIAVGRRGGRVDVYSVSPLALVHSYLAHFSTCEGLAFSPDNKTLATGSLDTTIKLWSIAKLKHP